MSRARDLASNVTALGALADIQAMLTARWAGTVTEDGGIPTGVIALALFPLCAVLWVMICARFGLVKPQEPGYHVNAVCRGVFHEALDAWRVYPATPFAVLA